MSGRPCEGLARLVGAMHIRYSVLDPMRPKRHDLIQHLTPHTVYSVTFSPNGELLACAGGYFYGGGFIRCIGNAGMGDGKWECVNRKETISCLSFDQTGQFIAASAWSMRHNYHPGEIFSIGGPCQPTWTFNEPVGGASRGNFNRYCATGVLMTGREFIIRHGAQLDVPVTHHALPAEVAGTTEHQHLTSSRVVMLGNTTATGVARHTWTSTEGTKTHSILALASNRGGSCRAPPTPHAAPISAIAYHHARSELITCDSAGSTAFWKCSQLEATPDLTLTAVRTEHKSAIEAACFLSDCRLVTADRAGIVCIWNDSTHATKRDLGDWSPRTLAAHPIHPRIAIGCKHGDNGGLSGCVFVGDIEGT